jgi:hypothetical protein
MQRREIGLAEAVAPPDQCDGAGLGKQCMELGEGKTETVPGHEGINDGSALHLVIAPVAVAAGSGASNLGGVKQRVRHLGNTVSVGGDTQLVQTPDHVGAGKAVSVCPPGHRRPPSRSTSRLIRTLSERRAAVAENAILNMGVQGGDERGEEPYRLSWQRVGLVS